MLPEVNLLVEPTLAAAGAPEASASAATVDASDMYRLAELGWFDHFGVRTDWRFEDSYLHRRPALLADAAARFAL